MNSNKISKIRNNNSNMVHKMKENQIKKVIPYSLKEITNIKCIPFISTYGNLNV